MKSDLNKIASLKFQDKIIINEKTFYRAQEYPDWNTQNGTVDYLFYGSWDKGKTLLPKPTYIVRLYIRVKKTKNKDGWIKSSVQNYKKAELIDVITEIKERTVLLAV